MHLFLSPHPDDAVYSTGGRISELVQQGQQVTIFTVMAGDVPAKLRPTPFIQEHFDRWGLGQNPAIGRRKEDAAAAAILGASIEFGPFADALYRTDEQGTILYPDREGIFGRVSDSEPIQPRPVAESIQLQPGDVVHAPLGAGGHVDHLLVRDIAVALAELYPHNLIYFYEEYPYIRDGRSVIRAALHSLQLPLVRVLRSIDEGDIQLRIAASACFRSQRSSFWENEQAMALEIRHLIAEAGGESEWRLLRSDES